MPNGKFFMLDTKYNNSRESRDKMENKNKVRETFLPSKWVG